MGRDGELGKALACGRHAERCALSGDIMDILCGHPVTHEEVKVLTTDSNDYYCNVCTSCNCASYLGVIRALSLALSLSVPLWFVSNERPQHQLDTSSTAAE